MGIQTKNHPVENLSQGACWNGDPNDLVTSTMAPAHPHATGVAMYLALFNFTNFSYYLLLVSVVIVVCRWTKIVVPGSIMPYCKAVLLPSDEWSIWNSSRQFITILSSHLPSNDSFPFFVSILKIQLRIISTNSMGSTKYLVILISLYSQHLKWYKLFESR